MASKLCGVTLRPSKRSARVTTPNGSDVQAVRWMIEELRVSLFAQVLGTSGPVSEKRIQAVLARLAGVLRLEGPAVTASALGLVAVLVAGGLWISVGGLAFHLARNTMEIVSDYFKARVNSGVTLQFQADVFAHLQKLSFSYHDQTPVGESMYRLTRDTDFIAVENRTMPPAIYLNNGQGVFTRKAGAVSGVAAGGLDYSAWGTAVATDFRVTPAQATSASSSMSPEHSSSPEPPVAGCKPATASARPVSTLQAMPSLSIEPLAFRVMTAAAGSVL